MKGKLVRAVVFIRLAHAVLTSIAPRIPACDWSGTGNASIILSTECSSCGRSDESTRSKEIYWITDVCTSCTVCSSPRRVPKSILGVSVELNFWTPFFAPKLEASNGENGLAIRVAIVDGERITIKTIKYFWISNQCQGLRMKTKWRRARGRTSRCRAKLTQGGKQFGSMQNTMTMLLKHALASRCV